jgi:hypothetical protein
MIIVVHPKNCRGDVHAAAPPLGSLTPAGAPLIDAENLFRQPATSPPYGFTLDDAATVGLMTLRRSLFALWAALAAERNPMAEIEITPEMERAGVMLLRDQFPDATGTSFDGFTVRDFFLAMWRANPKFPCASDKRPRRARRTS